MCDVQHCGKAFNKLVTKVGTWDATGRNRTCAVQHCGKAFGRALTEDHADAHGRDRGATSSIVEGVTSGYLNPHDAQKPSRMLGVRKAPSAATVRD